MYLHCNGCVIIDENDIGKTNIELLTDLIYETNKLRIPEDKIKYGLPMDLDTRPDNLYDHNTFVPFKIDPDYNYHLANQTGFVYRRRGFAEYFEDYELPPLNITKFPFRMVEMLPQINAHLPFPLQPEDIVDYEFTDTDAVQFTLRANPNSYIWTGGVAVRYNPPDPNFFKLVPKPFLPGFLQYGGV